MLAVEAFEAIASRGDHDPDRGPRRGADGYAVPVGCTVSEGRCHLDSSRRPTRNPAHRPAARDDHAIAPGAKPSRASKNMPPVQFQEVILESSAEADGSVAARKPADL
jgi:hypothetical protein